MTIGGSAWPAPTCGRSPGAVLATMVAVVLASVGPAGAMSVGLQQIAAVGSPSHITHAGDARLFVSTLDGRIMVGASETGASFTEFLNIDPLVSGGGERGLFATAFHPDYASNGFFFVSYTNNAGDSVVARYQVSGDVDEADPASGVVLLTIAQSQANHNGGQIAFGPDGYLYIGLGDGGGADDLPCHAQREDTLLGKLLRIDVDQNVGAPPYYGIPPDNPFLGGGGLADEVWATGLRNPWRFSFDRGTGALYIGDVGQNDIEEIDRQPAGSAGGENYGWKVMEGTTCFDPDPIDPDCPGTTPSCFDPALTLPVYEYSHSEGCSITGGFVYRGTGIPGLQGQYVFGDFCTGTIWAIEETAPGTWIRTDLVEAGFGLTSFGEGVDGELYAAVDFTNVVRLRSKLSRDQVRCLNEINKAGAAVVKEQGKSNLSCVKNAARGKVQKLGLPPQIQTAEACLTNDVGAKVDRRLAKLATKDDARCLGTSSQRPEFAYTTAAQVAAVAPPSARGVARALFGEDLDLAVVTQGADRNGAKCQAEVLKRANVLVDTLWKATLKGKKEALKGGRNENPPPVASAAALRSALLDYLETAGARRIDQASSKLVGGTLARCGEVVTPIGALFPGCDSVADPAAVADCAVAAARCQFCQSLEGFDELGLDCDSFDEGAVNASCEPAVCVEAGTGVNWSAAFVDCPRLSDYRLFASGDPTAALNLPGIPYDLTTPLFSDYAHKLRAVFLPPGGIATYDSDAAFDFPVGTVLTKTFQFLDDLRAPELGGEVVETRLLIRRPSGWVGRPFIWDGARTEALLTAGGGQRAVSWIDLAGTPRATTYEIPSTSECTICHGASAGDVPIGPKARLLNRDFAYAGGDENQLAHWSAAGILSGAPVPAAAPRLPVWDDPGDGSLDERARAYLESNCAHCHHPLGAARFSGLVLTAAEPLGPTVGVCKSSQAEPAANGGHEFDIVPGDPDASVLRFRMDSVALGIRMPELSKSVVHAEGVDLIHDWIASLSGSCD